MIACCGMLGLACGNTEKTASEKDSFDINSVKSHIVEMNKSYGDRFIKNDTSFYYSRYCKDAIAMPERVDALIGRDAIMSYYYDNGANRDFKIEILAGNIYGNNELVIEEGTYSFPDGKGGSFDNGKFIAIWKQEEGAWKLYREIWNTNNKPSSAP